MSKSSFSRPTTLISTKCRSNFKKPEQTPLKKARIAQPSFALDPVTDTIPSQAQDFSVEETHSSLHSGEIPMDDTASLEESQSSLESVDLAEFDEATLREEIRNWLDKNGSSFFHVEATKFLAAEKRKQDRKALKK